MLILVATVSALERPIVLEAGLAQIPSQNGIHLQAEAGVPFADWLSVDAGVVGRLPHGPVQDLDRFLLLIAYDANHDTSFRQPVDTEIVGAGVWADAGWKMPPAERGPWGAVGVRAGAEVLLFERGSATLARAYAEGESNEPAVYNPGPIVPVVAGSFGFVADAWGGRRLGLRLGARERVWVMKEGDYGNRTEDGEPAPIERRVWWSSVVTLGLLVAL